jgi:hypothetical protein
MSTFSVGDRFKIARSFGDSPSSEDYDEIRKSFNAYLRDGVGAGVMTGNNVDGESIRFRHLKSNPTKARFKDCSNFIWSATTSTIGSLGDDTYSIFRDTALVADNNCQIDYSPPSAFESGNLLQFSFWYYPYSLSSRCLVAPGIKVGGSWIALTDYERRVGVGCGFYSQFDGNPYSSEPGFRIHPYLQQTSYLKTGVGSYDRLGTVAYGGPVICTVTIPSSGISGYDITSISAFGMMVKRDVSNIFPRAVPKCTVYDRLFLSLITRDN